MINISSFLKEIKFNEKEVSRKIEEYKKAHYEGNETARRDVKIVLGKINAERLTKLYEKSPIYAKTKEMFERKHEIEIFNYEYAKASFKEAKMKEFQSIKLCNLFIQALVVNPQFKELRKALKEFDYNLNIEFKEEKNEEKGTGNSNIYGGETHDIVREYSVQIVVQ